MLHAPERSGRLPLIDVHVRPRSALFRTYRLEVSPLVVVEGGEDRVHVTRRCEDVRHVCVLGHAGEGFDLPPVLASVLRHLHQSVVGTHIDETLEQRRFVQRRDRAQTRRRLIEGNRVGGPDLAHDRDRGWIEVAGEVRADDRPGVAAIVAAIHALAGEVEAARRMS